MAKRNSLDSEFLEDLDIKQCETTEGNTVDKGRPTFGFDLKTPKTDLVLIVDGKEMFVTRVVLEMASSVFEKMFDENLKESGEDTIKICGKDYHDFAEFFACFYPGMMRKVTLENVYRILPLAFEYKVESLKSTCESVLAESLKTQNTEMNLFNCMDVAYKYDRQCLKAECLKQAVKIYNDDTSRIDKLTQMKSSFKDDLLETVFPAMRSDASKFRFWYAAGRHIAGKEIDFLFDNTDSKYLISSCGLKWNDKEKNTVVVLPELWSGLQISMIVSRDKYFNFFGKLLTSRMDFSLHAQYGKGNIKYRSSVVIEFVNLIPCKRLFKGKATWKDLETAESQIRFLTMEEKGFSSENDGFILNDQFEIRVHLLVNRLC